MARAEVRQIGRYEIRRELGRGVMGVVYQAWDPVLGRTIALKTIKPVTDTEEQREAWERRFLIEAQAAARLSHPAIVVVHDVGRDPETDVSYMALEYLEGETLAQRRVPGRPVPWPDALRILGQVAEGLSHAHSQGVVHRDIKPANIMVLTSGDAKILDFGVARLDEASLTSPGDLCGTPLYMSPEQASGHPLDARSDIFSLGAVAWTLLTGQTPFDAPSLSGILTRVMHRSPPPPSELVAGIPKAVDEIVERALAKMPEDRYPDARQLAEDVGDVLAGREPRHRAEWNPLTTGERTRVALDGERDERLPALDLAAGRAGKPARRRARTWLAGALLLALAASALAYLHSRPPDERLWPGLLRRAVTSRPARWAASRFHRGSAGPSPATGALATGTEAATAPSAVTASVTADAGSEAIGASAGVLGPATPPAPATASSAPSAAPTAPATAAPAAPSRAPVSHRARTAYLSIGFEHSLKGGTLEVWVDSRRIARERLDSRVAKKVLLFELRKGSFQQTLQLSPGRHQVRVRVRSEGETTSARTSALFRAGSTRRLEISLGRLSGKVELEWK